VAGLGAGLAAETNDPMGMEARKIITSRTRPEIKPYL
jgi:hypothetical protein